MEIRIREKNEVDIDMPMCSPKKGLGCQSRDTKMADFHLGRKSDDGDSDFVSDAGLEGFVDIARVTGREKTKDDEDLSRWVHGEVAACLT